MAKPRRATKHEMAMDIVNLYKAMNRQRGTKLSQLGYETIYNHVMRFKADELAAELNKTKKAARRMGIQV